MTLPSPFAQTSQPLHQRINILHYHLVHRQDPKPSWFTLHINVSCHKAIPYPLPYRYHQLWYILYMFCKMICPVQLPFLTISIQTSYEWAFAGSGTFQILPPVSDHQIRACIFPDNFLHNFCLWTESIRFAVIKMIEPPFHPKFLPVRLTI